MDKSVKVLLSMFLVLVLSGIVYAASDKAEEVKTTAAVPETTEAPKNMTYGQCVSEQASIKNECYSRVKSTLNACKDQAASEGKKDASKQCKAAYKKDKKQCKALFKSSKKECAKIKHNFFETLGSALK
jgi:hypothetical protein